MEEKIRDTLMRNFRFSIKLLPSPEARLGAKSSIAFASTVPDQKDSGKNKALGVGAFQECSGLEVAMDTQEIKEGGRNDGVIQRVGRASYSPIVLKRGMFYTEGAAVNSDLWKWIQNIVAGIRPVPRYDGLIEIYGSTNDVVATWIFERGLPNKISGPSLNAQTGEIAIEELTIAHQGLSLGGV